MGSTSTTCRRERMRHFSYSLIICIIQRLKRGHSKYIADDSGGKPPPKKNVEHSKERWIWCHDSILLRLAGFSDLSTVVYTKSGVDVLDSMDRQTIAGYVKFLAGRIGRPREELISEN